MDATLQVSIYFPEQQHPRFGILRAVVKDTTDENNSSSRGQMVYLDSDGKVANNIATPDLNRPNPLTDGRWHMVTITTQPDLSTGFLLFLDGIVVGTMRRGTYTGDADDNQVAVVLYRSVYCLGPGTQHL